MHVDQGSDDSLVTPRHHPIGQVSPPIIGATDPVGSPELRTLHGGPNGLDAAADSQCGSTDHEPAELAAAEREGSQATTPSTRRYLLPSYYNLRCIYWLSYVVWVGTFR